MKKCSKCQIEKTLDNFGKDKSRGDGVETQCKLCKRARRNKAYRDNMKEEKIKQKEYYNNNTEKCKARSLTWKRSLSPEIRKQKNSEAVNKYREKHGDRVRAYNRKRYHEKIWVRLSDNVRTGINACLKGKNKRHWEDLVEYTLEDLIKHIESLFTDDMSWEYLGRLEKSGKQRDKWIELDHIIPISHFNFDSFEHPDFKKCWSLDNLRPLWHSQNRSEGNRR